MSVCVHKVRNEDQAIGKGRGREPVNDDPHSSHAGRERERERERAGVDSFGVRDAQALSDEEISRTFLQEKSLKY